MSPPKWPDSYSGLPVVLKASGTRNSFIRVDQKVFNRLRREARNGVVLLKNPLSPFPFVTLLSNKACNSTQRTNDFSIPKVELDFFWIETLGLHELAECEVIGYRGHVEMIRKVHVRPETEDDWEVLEENATQIQTVVLDQIQVVGDGSKIIIFYATHKIRAVITKLEPECNIGRLRNDTELIVEPKIRAQRLPELPEAFIPDLKIQSAGLENASTQAALILGLPKVFRVAVYGKDSKFMDDNPHLQAMLNTFTTAIFVKNCRINDFEEPFVIKVQLHVPNRTRDTYEEEKFLKCFKIDTTKKNLLPNNSLLIHEELAKGLNMTIGAPVLVSISEHDEFETKMSQQQKLKLVLHGITSDERILEEFNPFPLIIPSSLFLSKTDYSLSNGHKSLIVESREEFEDILEIVKSDSDQENIGKRTEEPKDCILELDGVIQSVNTLSLSIHDNRLSFNILLVGESGLGKSFALNTMKTMLSEWPLFVFVYIISCKRLIGKKVDLVIKEFSKALSECNIRGRSVVFLDDLDRLCSQTPEEEHNHAEEILKQSLTFAISRSIAQFLSNGIPILATISELQNLHETLLPGRGSHQFQVIHHLQRPSNGQRRIFFQHYYNCLFSKIDHNEDSFFELLEAMTEGYSPEDLKYFIRKLMLKVECGSIRTFADLRNSAECFEPISLWNSGLQQPSSKDESSSSWDDVGGLHKIKQILTETVIWPGKYPDLFAQCPLRRRSGVILYGAPGTGKTMIAGLLAKESKLNFIAIKGPELLSKYIGASESAVRTTFERAKAAQPCILFFDEFDSLAPRRGHDSTGVTDRVVNQLLTQLDGVDDLQKNGQVYVIAATSRPDLIDPALLRPGRIDKKLYCAMPDRSERLGILQAISRKLHLSERGNNFLKDLAEATHGFTGADLQALLYTAKLTAVKQKLIKREKDIVSTEVNEDKPTIDDQTFAYDSKLEIWDRVSREKSNLNDETSHVSENAKNVNEITLVDVRHLQDALNDTRPSVTKEDLLKFETIYQQFDGGEGKIVNYTNGPKLTERARATLA